MTQRPPIEPECECSFKDPVCGYQGTATWCDRTRARCEKIGNLERFNGALPPISPGWERPGMRHYACIGVFLWTFFFVTHWPLAIVGYFIACVLYLPHFWHPRGPICGSIDRLRHARGLPPKYRDTPF